MPARDLHIWRPAEGPAGDLTLIGFYDECAEPLLRLQERSPRTLDGYREALAHWERITGDPPLSELSGHQGKGLLVRFYRQLREDLPNANTRHKHWAVLQRLLDWTGRQSRANPHGFGILDDPPFVPAPKKERRAVKRCFTLDELWRWLEILPECAHGLRGLSGPARKLPGHAWWRAVILVAYNTGLRPETLFGMRWEHLGPCDQDVCPRGEGSCRAPHRFRPPRAIVKGRLDREFWLNHAALEALEPLRAPSGPIFGHDWSERYTTLNSERMRQQRRAGLEPHQLSLYALRRTFATEAARINPLAMRMQMGHSGGEWRMAVEHYLFAPAVVAGCLEQLPQPGPVRQGMLF